MIKLLVVLVSAAISGGVLAQPLADNDEKKVLSKCYVSLLGGDRTIYKVTIEEDKIPTLPNVILGKSIRVAGKSGYSEIQKVYECIADSKDFKAGRAKHLDKLQLQ